MCSDKRLLIANCDIEAGFNFAAHCNRSFVNKTLIGFSYNTCMFRRSNFYLMITFYDCSAKKFIRLHNY